MFYQPIRRTVSAAVLPSHNNYRYFERRPSTFDVRRVASVPSFSQYGVKRNSFGYHGYRAGPAYGNFTGYPYGVSWKSWKSWDMWSTYFYDIRHNTDHPSWYQPTWRRYAFAYRNYHPSSSWFYTQSPSRYSMVWSSGLEHRTPTYTPPTSYAPLTRASLAAESESVALRPWYRPFRPHRNDYRDIQPGIEMRKNNLITYDTLTRHWLNPVYGETKEWLRRAGRSLFDSPTRQFIALKSYYPYQYLF